MAILSGADGRVTHGELQEVAEYVAFYGMTDFLEIMRVIGSNREASLSASRPVKLKHWLQVKLTLVIRFIVNCILTVPKN